MKYYRLRSEDGALWAREDREELVILSGAPYQDGRDTGKRVRLEGSRLLPPVAPSKIVAVGLNYKDHAAERGKGLPKEPLIFFKPPSALIGPEEPIVLPKGVGRVDHEAEMGLVLGRRVSGEVSPEEALSAIFGVVGVNDVTARELQDKDVQFTRAKGFDTFCPVGPCLATGLQLEDLAIRCRVNGALRQESRTSQLIFSAPYLVAFVARVMTLVPGDIISTGTPAGVGPLHGGDRVEIEIDGCGVLANPVSGA